MKFLVWKRCISIFSMDKDMVYSPYKYRETEGIKERNRFFENRTSLEYERQP
ncbi:hypothetical protein [Kineothrix sedimenti]|uniref:Uncharacterized protein n=1 Tax=Kineothrix sedimenti TaxID=3123317 RepID=A0ABZ3ETH5_9FIRM